MKKQLWFFIAFCFLCCTARASDRMQLRAIRQQLVSKRVYLSVANASFSGLSGWEFVTLEPGGYFVKDLDRWYTRPPSSLLGSSGKIVAVQNGNSVQATDNADETYVDYIAVAVKFDSGELISSTWYVSNPLTIGIHPYDKLAFEETRAQHKQEAAELEKRLAGKSLYFPPNSYMYDMGLQMSDIGTAQKGGYAKASIQDVPPITPIPVTEVIYSEKYDYASVHLKLSDGREAQFLSGCVFDTFTKEKPRCAFLSLPPGLTVRETEAIRKHSYFVGMSEVAVYLSKGYPERINASSYGSTQLVYPGSYIYIGKNHKVVSFQN